MQGEEALRERAVYLRHEAPFRAAAYEADHKELSIEVLAPRAVRPQRPWATIFIDQYSRLIVGWALSLRPTAAEVLAALRMAVAADSERGFGGVPTVLRWDGGLEFAAHAMTGGAGAGLPGRAHRGVRAVAEGQDRAAQSDARAGADQHAAALDQRAAGGRRDAARPEADDARALRRRVRRLGRALQPRPTAPGAGRRDAARALAGRTPPR